MLKTEKLFLENPFLASCNAKIIGLTNNAIITDKTIAFPEGGGQAGDVGKIISKNSCIDFIDTQKSVGRTIFLDDFPTIQVETPIMHIVDENLNKSFSVGDEVCILIDIKRRAQLMTAHSGLHLILMIAESLRENLYSKIKGCNILPNNARIDFMLSNRFSVEEMEYINQKMRKIIAAGKEIETYPHKQEREAWYWRCEDYVCPCGGTHLPNSKFITSFDIKKKNKGKNLVRISAEFVCDDSLCNLFQSEDKYER